MLVLLLFPILIKNGRSKIKAMNHPEQWTHFHTRLQRVQPFIFSAFFSVKYQKFHVLQMQYLYQTKTLSRKSGTDQMYPCMTQA